MLWHAFDISVHKLMIWSLKKMRWTFSLKSIEKLNLRIDFTSNLIFVVVRTSGCKMCVLLELFFFFCSTLTKAIMILFVFLLLKWVMTSFCEYKLFSVVVFLLSTRFNNRSDLITKFFYRQMKIDSKIMFIRYLVSKVVKAANSITSWNKMNLMKILYTSTKEKELIQSMFIEIQRKFFLMMSLRTEGSSI